jgi:hypothetical protein
MTFSFACASSFAAAGASVASRSRFSSVSAVWAMRIECTDMAGPAMRWISPSMTVFQDGTISPSLRSHAAI